ncbi:hypothetical protein B0H14DRAFT_2575385 [Mycena olivaceomarginata]|nr:hypothetical protein B0H14DRAFT_2575385 [Mycena olivaceomarginata]
MMLIAVIAPEVMVGFAARQFFTAWWYSKKYDISITHGFFVSMGGFVSRRGHRPITTPEQLRDVAEYLTDLRTVDAKDIKDKSKEDALSKGMALSQGLWFTLQCLARVHQNLPVTELEAATLAFAVVNIFIWILWWNKPLDVQRPILVGPKEDSDTPTGELLHNQENILVPPEEQVLDADATPWQVGFWDGIGGALFGTYDDYAPTLYTSVPSFWSTDDRGQEEIGYSFHIECLVGTVFGAIHCAAWNADFPSTDEMWLWRSCSLTVAAVPVIFMSAMMAVVDVDSTTGKIVLSVVLFILPLIYIIARLFLIILPLIALRSLPPGALTDSFMYMMYILVFVASLSWSTI